MTQTGRYASEESAARAKDSMRRSTAARSAALQRLKKLHPEDFQRLYEEEARARGIKPMGSRIDTKRRKAEKLRAELAALEAELEKDA